MDAEPPQEKGLIDFSTGAVAPAQEEPAPPKTVQKLTLTGELVEVPEPPPPPPKTSETPSAPGPEHGGTPEEPGPDQGKPVFRMTYCRDCGVQNEEGATECRRCRRPLPVLTEPPPDLVPLRRSWGFDLLGLAWIGLGFAAVYCGRFLIKAHPERPGATLSDYLWTGAVVCAPGILIIMRHYFCRMLFWLMTVGSLMVWSVLGFLWLYVGLHVTDNGRVGLAWLAALSVLSVLSYITVRLNDEFDFG